MDTKELDNRKVRYSQACQLLLENMNAIDLDDLEKWFFSESCQTVIGNGTIQEYLQYKKSQ